MCFYQMKKIRLMTLVMLHPSSSNSTDCLLSTVACSKLQHWFLHSGSPSYFEPFLSLSSCSYSTRHSHPDHQYLTVPPFHSSVFKSVKHFGHSFAFDAPKIWNELLNDVHWATAVAPLHTKAQNLPVCKSLSAISSPVTPVSPWLRPGYVIGLTFIVLFYVQMCLRICH